MNKFIPGGPIRIGRQDALDVSLMSVEHEGEERFSLVRSVSVTEKGVAVCEHGLSGVVMQLAAVRVADGSEAQHAPFEQGSDGTLNLVLPADRPSKVGFFIGYAGPITVASAVRLGEYPGMPLITSGNGGISQPREALLNLGGIKTDELDEQRWAGQVGLFDQNGLGFDPARSRGLFSRAQQRIGTNTWDQQRLVVVPRGMGDLVESADPRVRPDVFQVLGYEARKPQSALPLDLEALGYASRSPSIMLSLVGRSETADGLAVGFGRRFETQAQTSSIALVGLRGAFELNIVPSAE